MATWATSGAATDFTAADGPTSGEETMTRSTTADSGYRYAILGTTNYTDVEVGVSAYVTALTESYPLQSVIARWTDANNHLWVEFAPSGLSVFKIVAGVDGLIASGGVAHATSTWYVIRLVVVASGRGVATVLSASGATLATVNFEDAALATGGALATGKPGFADFHVGGTASTRYYDNFYVMQPSAEPIAIYGGLLAEVTSDNARRLSSDSNSWGQVPAYRGSYFTVPPAGTNNRKARVAVAARRNDIVVAADDPVTDSITVRAYWTPIFLAVPR